VRERLANRRQHRFRLCLDNTARSAPAGRRVLPEVLVRLQPGRGWPAGPGRGRAGWRPGSPGGTGPAGLRPCGTGPDLRGPRPRRERGSTSRVQLPTFSGFCNRKPARGAMPTSFRTGRPRLYVWDAAHWSPGSMPGAIQGPARLREHWPLRDRLTAGCWRRLAQLALLASRAIAGRPGSAWPAGKALESRGTGLFWWQGRRWLKLRARYPGDLYLAPFNWKVYQLGACPQRCAVGDLLDLALLSGWLTRRLISPSANAWPPMRLDHCAKGGGDEASQQTKRLEHGEQPSRQQLLMGLSQ